MLQLVRTMFNSGGYHIQFNVLDTELLRDAQKHPENHRDLVVRVAGFSAFFHSTSCWSTERSHRAHSTEVPVRTRNGKTGAARHSAAPGAGLVGAANLWALLMQLKWCLSSEDNSHERKIHGRIAINVGSRVCPRDECGGEGA